MQRLKNYQVVPIFCKAVSSLVPLKDLYVHAYIHNFPAFLHVLKGNEGSSITMYSGLLQDDNEFSFSHSHFQPTKNVIMLFSLLLTSSWVLALKVSKNIFSDA